MKLRVIALALAFGVFFGGSVLVVALANVAYPDYGQDFLNLVGSVCPGYRLTLAHVTLAHGNVIAAVVGSLYGFTNGAFCGAVFAWCYNLFVRA